MSAPERSSTTKKKHKLSTEGLCSLLGDATRWRMLERFATGEAQMVSVLAKELGKSPALISKHIKMLRRYGVIKLGIGRLYTITDAFRPEPGTLDIDFGQCVFRGGAKG